MAAELNFYLKYAPQYLLINNECKMNDFFISLLFRLNGHKDTLQSLQFVSIVVSIILAA